MTDYYPYGMDMPGRTFSSELYRYGYQGSERDPEMSGGAGYTTYFRALDPRIGRWLTPDPKVFPWQSPYVSMDGNPVALVDPWGAETLKEVTVTAKDKGPHPESKGFEPSSVDANTLKPMGSNENTPCQNVSTASLNNDNELNVTVISVIEINGEYKQYKSSGEEAIQRAKNDGWISGDILYYDNYIENEHYTEVGGDPEVDIDLFVAGYVYVAGKDENLTGKGHLYGAKLSYQEGFEGTGGSNSFVSSKFSKHGEIRMDASGNGRVLITIPQLSRGKLYRTQLDFGASKDQAHVGARGVLDATFWEVAGGNFNFGARVIFKTKKIERRIDRINDWILDHLFWWINKGAEEMNAEVERYNNLK